VKLDSVADFLDVDAIVKVAVRFVPKPFQKIVTIDFIHSTQCTHVHPGYGFLSENPALPLALAAMAGSIVFVGPSPDALKVSSDKMLSRALASSLGVSIAAGIRVSSAADVKNFAKSIGFPMMIKALDGGGGRGIRVIESEGGVEEAFKRLVNILNEINLT
jgi:pyruvate carboxylase